MKKIRVLMAIVATMAVVAVMHPAQAASSWTFGVPVDITQLTTHGYSAKSLALAVRCSVRGASGVEAGFGSTTDVAIADPGQTLVTVVAKSFQNNIVAQSYSCDANVGTPGAGFYLATTGGPATGALSGTIVHTALIALVIQAKSASTAQPPYTLSTPHPSVPIKPLPPGATLPEVAPTLSAKVVYYGLVGTATCPGTMRYAVRVTSSTDADAPYSYEFRTSTNANDTGIGHGVTPAVVRNKISDLEYKEPAFGKGTHVIWFQMVSPMSITLQKFQYTVACP